MKNKNCRQEEKKRGLKHVKLTIKVSKKKESSFVFFS